MAREENLGKIYCIYVSIAQMLSLCINFVVALIGVQRCATSALVWLDDIEKNSLLELVQTWKILFNTYLSLVGALKL